MKKDSKAPKLVELGTARRETRGTIFGNKQEMDGVRLYS
jgi:hypothetical protein